VPLALVIPIGGRGQRAAQFPVQRREARRQVVQRRITRASVAVC
jgi:hypothetical protein